MAIIVPVTKKGPKGISLFKPFLPNKINPIPIIAPIKKAENKAAKIFGKPIKIPMKKTNFTSPNPIHLPLEIRKIKRKNRKAPSAAYKAFKISHLLNIKCHIPDIKIAG